MNRPAATLMIVIVLCLSACVALPPTPSAVPSAPAPQPTVPAKTGKLRLAAPSTEALDDIPFWIAMDTLKQQGYVVETTQYARYDLVTTGLASGEVDIAASSHQTAWAAIAKGAPIRAVVSRLGMMYVLSAKSGVKTCADLQGRGMACGATTSVLAALTDSYFKRNCPGTQPQIAVIASSPNRFAALLSGTVEAAMLDEGDALQLERQAPGKFHILRYFAEEFPLIEQAAFYAHNDFAATHPAIVKDFVSAYIQAVRRVQDPQTLREALAKYLPDDSTALANAAAYLAHKAWDVNGGLSPEHLQYTLTFLTDAKMVPSGLQVEQLVDLTYLNTVLAEIGRK